MDIIQHPKISIIVPVYNAENYLNRCVDSIVAQSFTDFEVLLVDDGSKDKSGEICDEYARKDSRISVFHKENGGVSSARNLGLDKASGEYITFIDADDFLEKESFSVSLFDESYDLIQIPRNRGSFMKTYSHDISCDSHKAFLKHLYRNFYFECWGRLYKRNIVSDIRFDENVKIGEDLLFLLDVYDRINKFFLSSQGGGYYYAEVVTSAMHSKNSDEHQSLLANLVYERFVKLNNTLAGIVFIEFFYNCNVCDVRNPALDLSLKCVLKLPLTIKDKVKFIIKRFLMTYIDEIATWPSVISQKTGILGRFRGG